MPTSRAAPGRAASERASGGAMPEHLRAAGCSFVDAVAVERVGDGRFAVRIAPDWGFRGRPNGGYLLAVVTRAVTAATGRAHPHAISGSFVRSPQSGPADVHVELVKSGRQVTNARATLRQDNRIVLDALVALGDPVDGPPLWLDLPDPPPAPFAECVPAPHRPGLLDHLDIRYDPVTLPAANGEVSGEARVRGWVSFRDGSAPDPAAALLAADVLPASVRSIGLPGWAPTVQMTVYLRGVPAPGPLGVSVNARFVAAGWFDEVADVVDSTGALVAQARQLALIGGGSDRPS